MAVTVDTRLAASPNNSNVTLLNLGTSTITGEVTDNTLRFGSGNTINFFNNSGVYHGTTGGVAATPYGEAGNYFAAEPGTGIVISYASAQRYFGINWGSVDAGNSISFYNGTTLVYSISGSDVAANPNGSQGADGSYYVNLNFTSPTAAFNRVVLTTPSPAFEFGDIASSTANVPTTAGQTGTPAVVTATDSGTGKVVGFDTTPANLSGTVFLDSNADGTRDGGDAGASGVTVRLLNSAGTVVSTDVTDANGRYDFNNVATGTYTVAVTSPSGARFSPTVSGASGSQVNSAGNASITLAAGSSGSVNAGVYVPATVSGIAFTDANGNGVRDSGEAVVAGQTVQLLSTAGAVVATTTSTTGAYSFTGVTPGTYQVGFVAPSGTAFTAQDQGANDAVDSDVNSAGRTASFTLASGGAAANVSAGTYAPATVSGSVFTDSNGDGVRGTGEAVAAGVTVQLINAAGTVVATTTSSGTGAYSFTGVTPGTYQVGFVAPSGTAFTAQDQGANDAIDSDAAPATGRTAAFTLASGGSAANVSAGLYTPVSVSGVAFTDANGDGIQGAGEAGIAGQAVQLLNASGAVVGTTITGANGAYSFTGAAPGTYQVQFAAASGSSFTAQDQGANDSLDSDVGSTGRTAALTLASGQAATNVSAGSYVPTTVSGTAFTDTNGDGIQGTGEAGIAGQTVQLLSAAGAVVATTATGAGGAYAFNGAIPGQYQVGFVAPAGTLFTAQDRGTSDAVDSDVNGAGRTGTIAVASGQPVSNVSAGTFAPVTVSGSAFTDADGDGVRGSGEAGVAGVVVRLLDADGNRVTSTSTVAGGTYSFAGLAPGQYQVQFVAPSGTVFTDQDAGGNDATDSDANPTTGRTALITATSGQTVANVSAGIFTPVATGTGNAVFVDRNANGFRDAGEAGVAGATVRLLNGAGAAVATTTTAEDGTYGFTGVAPGTYQVQFVAPAGTVFTAPDRGSNDAVDSDAAPATGRTANITVPSGGTISNVAAGIYAPVSVSGTVFTDTNGDGLQGAGETGGAGQTVQLLSTAGAVLATTTTSGTGAYSFAGLTPDQYQVGFAAPSGTVFTAQDGGNNAAIDSDANPTTGRSAVITLASGQSATNVSAGTYVPVSLGGAAFADTNGDGIQGTGEAGLSGQTVQLLSTAGAVVATTVTGTGGAYGFTGLAPGQYQVAFAAPSGTVFTAQDSGGNDAADSDVNPATGRSAVITLASGQAAANVSAGSYTPVTLSGTVFADGNGDGVRGTGEAGIAGQTVQLLAAGAVVATTTTGAGGAYAFTGVAPGTYQVGFVTPSGTVFTAQDQGGNDAADSDANPATGRTAAVTLPSGGSATNLSAGLFAPATVSGVAFTDADGNGIEGTTEAGTAGVTVQLLAAGAVVATTTGADGAYAFTGVAPGTYQVGFVAPAGTRFTAQDQGGNDAADSDAAPATGRTAAFTVASGGSATNVSAGTYVPVGVSGVAFTDTNGDGIQGSGEAGISGQTVQLLNGAGAVVATTTTGTGGAYAFTGVTPGTYQVQFVAAPGTAFTEQDQGVNDAVDSDVGGTGRTAAFTLASGGSAANVSAGKFVPASVSGFMFTDSNGDGIRGAGDAAVAGATVQLLNAADAVVATTTTSGTGAYAFTGLAPGQYQVQFVPPAGTAFTALDRGTDDALDSDANPAGGRSAVFTLASGGSVTNLSAGTYAPVTVSGSVFTDADGNGLRAGGEAGVAGATVQLLDGIGNLAATTTTGADGAYGFTGLAPGQYQVAFAAPASSRFTAQDQGTNDAIDSDAAPATGRTAAFTLASGGSAANVSAGVYTPVSVSGVAFTDANGDGIQGTGEAGIAGQTVQLLNSAGTVAATTTTGAGGAYAFAGASPGTYQVRFVAVPGSSFTVQDQGTSDALDSDVDGAGRTAAFTLASGGGATNVSAGSFAPVTVSGTAFTDTNGDGIQGAGEAGVSGQTVQLLNGAGTVTTTTTIGAGGAYAFTGVAPGTYQVQFIPIPGTAFTAQDRGGNDALDSDVDVAGRTAALTLASGTAAANVSAGTYAPAAVSGLAFTDGNGNGIRDAGDTGLAGVTVRLLGTAGNLVASTTTSGTGAYGFAGVAPGRYAVEFAAPAGSAFTLRDRGDDATDSDAAADGRTAAFDLTSGAAVGNVAAGLYVPATIGGTGGVVFNDVDGNGVRDAGDGAVAGVTVRLLAADGGVVATTTTDAAGSYLFGAAPGTYQVQFVAPPGTAFTARDQGGNDAADSDADVATGLAPAFTVASGGTVGGIAAGLYVPGTVSGLVFDDADADGVRGGAEAGQSGVTVRLLGAAGAVLATTATDANGAYAFTGAAPGTYQVQFVAPSGRLFSPQDRGGNDATDSDTDPATGLTAAFALNSGGAVTNLSAGTRTSAGPQLGGSVWLDANGNGVRDAGEPATPGVAVRLLDRDGNPLGPVTTTDANGAYAFLGLTPGDYRVGFAPLIGTLFTAQDAGGSEALDSDASPVNGVSSLLVTLPAGGSSTFSTAGLVLDLSNGTRGAPYLILTEGNDGYPGTDGAEQIHGRGGDDAINGLGGNDALFGEDGNDSLNGLGGNDVLSGGDGNDNVQGLAGDDLILGGAGDDIGEGGDGNDTLIAGAGDDTMQGEGGDDLLFGGGGDDIMTGNQGDDFVAGGDGDDRVVGSDGNDIVVGGRDGGTMSLDAGGRIAGIVTGDTLEGNGGADAFVWQAGDGVDLIFDLNPSEGDTLTIYGYDRFTAIQRTEDGRIALYLGPNAGFVLNNGLFQGASPNDVLPGVRFIPDTAGAPGALVGTDLVVPALARNWVSNFRGQGGIAVSQDFLSNYAPTATPSDGDNDLTGTAGADALAGLGGDDVILGLGGDDVLDGGAGNDVLAGGDGNDTLVGGLGTDVMRVDTAAYNWRIVRQGGDVFLRNLATGEADTGQGIERVSFLDGTTVDVTALPSTSALEYIASYNDLIATFGTDGAAGLAHLFSNGLAEGRSVRFDGRAYIASSPDLIRAFGSNEDNGARHFIEAGRFEGRGITFDPYAYLASYDDLLSTFGKDIEASTAHYIDAGFAEGRRPIFESLEYIGSYDDLIAAFGTNGAAGSRHYVLAGRDEGRSITFDPLNYLATNEDLIQAFGANAQAAAEHWINVGHTENRAQSGFDAAQYLRNYADLQTVYGTDLEAATLHYVQAGFAEGRTDELLG